MGEIIPFARRPQLILKQGRLVDDDPSITRFFLDYVDADGIADTVWDGLSRDDALRAVSEWADEERVKFVDWTLTVH